jgi:hypothetical protein
MRSSLNCTLLQVLSAHSNGWACTMHGEDKEAHKILVGKPERKTKAQTGG